MREQLVDGQTSTSRTIGEALDRSGGISPGFDLLRVALAISVVSYHGLTVTTGRTDIVGPVWLLCESILPMFFALSGFLIIASARRLSLGEFAIHRGLRIFPALAVEIVFSAVVIGGLFTTTPLLDYYTSRPFVGYFLNIFGDIHYFLPGVFENNPHWGIVNASLWTIPWELGLYGLMAVLIITGLIRNSRFLLVLGLATIALPVITTFLTGHQEQEHGSSLASILTSWEFRVVPFFLAGALFYLLRYRIPASKPLAIALVLLVAIGTAVIPTEWDGPYLNLVLCPVLTYLTVFIGVSKLPKLPLFGRGDYSYGIYLYGYPVQQMVHTTGLDGGTWWLNAALALPAIVLFAVFSWHVIERPILRRRHWFIEQVRRRAPIALAA